MVDPRAPIVAHRLHGGGPRHPEVPRHRGNAVALLAHPAADLGPGTLAEAGPRGDGVDLLREAAHLALGGRTAPGALAPHEHHGAVAGGQIADPHDPTSVAHSTGAAQRAAGHVLARLHDDPHLAVFLELARTVPEPVCDLTFVFYAAEEVAAEHNGLGELYRERPELLAGDVAIVGEPTTGRIEEELRRGDPAGEIGAAYLAKELLREVYATRGPKTAQRRLARFYAHCNHSSVPELGSTRPHHPGLGSRDPGLARHRAHQRGDRGQQPAHQEDQTRRPRLPEL